jgi:hypothetical protein
MIRRPDSVRSIATVARVSPTTAWRALTGRGGVVMPALKARVMRARAALATGGADLAP